MSQQGHGTLLHLHAQVNVKRNVTGSREGRRKPKACLLNVTHQLRLLAQVPQSLDTGTQGSLATTAHWNVLGESEGSTSYCSCCHTDLHMA